MKNAELVDIFEQIADMMEIVGQDRFRINTYRRAARTIGELSDDIQTLADEGRLTELQGIGKGTAERIEHWLAHGTIDVYEQLRKQIPVGLLELRNIPNVGPKTIAQLYNELDVESMDDLKQALEGEKIKSVKGIGPKTIEQMRQGIQFVTQQAGRTPIGRAWPIVSALLNRLRDMDQVIQADVAGSFRRRKETIGDIDLLATARDGQAVIDAFTQFPEVVQVLQAGSTKASVRGQRGLQIDLRVVEENQYGSALLYFTGSKEHNVRLREIAVKKDWKLNEYGLFSGETRLAGTTEESVYSRLGLTYMPPELREDRGEIQAADDDRLPDLVTLDDIRADLHMHTTASDGRNTIADMVAAAKKCSYSYLAITDHSASSRIANGLDPERLREQIDTIRTSRDDYKKFTVLTGSEVDIMADGTLDFDDDLLAELDFVVASVHSHMNQPADTITRRVIQAMKNPYVDAIGHPTARMIGQRDMLKLDMNELFRAAADTNTALEVNASWSRLDLNDVHIRQAIDAGVKLFINTDAHGTDQLWYMQLGVATARRGWATTADILNTLTWPQLKKKLKDRPRSV